MTPAENIVGSQVCPGHRGQNGLAGIPWFSGLARAHARPLPNPSMRAIYGSGNANGRWNGERNRIV